MFERGEFEALAAALKGLRGRFVLSINDVPEIRELFGLAEIREVGATYRTGMQPTAARELIISGGAL